MTEPDQLVFVYYCVILQISMDKTLYSLYFFQCRRCLGIRKPGNEAEPKQTFSSTKTTPMKPTDTTNPSVHHHENALLNKPETRRSFDLAAGLRIHLAGLYDCKFGPEWGSGGKRESDYMHHIDITFSGRRQVRHDCGCLDLEPGMVYFFPGNTPAERCYVSKGRVLYLKFRCEWLPGVDPLLDWPERAPSLIGPFAAQDWLPWLNPDKRADVNTFMRLQAQVVNWLATVLPPLDTLLGRHLATYERFTQVFSLVEEKLGADLRISELAKAYGTSLQTFSTAFSSSTQLSPKEYLNRRLNQEALQLVIGTDLKMKVIAERLRFTDEFYFSRFFQKLNGVPATLYRARFRTA